MQSKSIIVGTAGHIDHGKTSLVKALTGMDADRLEEEKRRGITIDIGFAHLELASPEPAQSSAGKFRIGFVDVPGHERFVRNMLAGIGGIDIVLLVIAADEGIKPQTREHFEICRLLSVRRGIIVLTKTDLMDPEMLDVVRMEVEEYVRGSFLDTARAPVVAVSAKTGAGLDELKRELVRAAQEVSAKDSNAAFRLPIDRVFVMKGFGSVVTGTLVAGSVHKEDEVEIFPAGERVRVRGVQVHGEAMDEAVAGERTALNLASIAKDELSRGMTLAPPGLFRATRRLDVELNLLQEVKPLKDRARVHFHLFTSEMVAQVVLHGGRQLEPGQTAFARLMLPEPILALPGDRFILRQYSPVVTIGGGVVLDAAPLAKKLSLEMRIEFLTAMCDGDAQARLLARVLRREQSGLSLADAAAETGWTPVVTESLAKKLIAQKELEQLADLLISPAAFAQVKAAAVAAAEAFHGANPLVAGISKEELREKLGARVGIFAAALEQLVREKKLEVAGEQVRAAGRTVVMKDDEAEAKQTIEKAFASAGLKVPALKDVLAGLPLDRARAQKIVTLLLRDRVLVKLADDLVFHQSALDSLRHTIKVYKTQSRKIDVAKFKDLTGTSRKYAIPLLEFLDRERVTRREGDARVIL